MAARPVMSPRARGSVVSGLCVVVLSEAFKGFWNDLASDLDVALDMVEPRAGEVVTPRAGTAAVVVAAGGAESEAIQWLGQQAAPRGIPVFVVGTDPGRRTAMQLTARGADDYFALPHHLQIFRNAAGAALQQR